MQPPRKNASVQVSHLPKAGDLPAHYIAVDKHGVENMVYVTGVEKDGIIIETFSGPPEKIPLKQYNKWYRIQLSKDSSDKKLYKIKEKLYLLDPQNVKTPCVIHTKHIVRNNLSDLTLDLDWYVLQPDGELRPLSEVALFEVTLKSSINTFIGLQPSK
jgi:hypothetical protein